MGKQPFGEPFLNRTIATRRANDTPTASQVALRNSCPGIGRIPPKTLLFKDGTLYYKPQQLATLINIGAKGCADAYPS